MSSSNQWFFALKGEKAGPIDVQTLAGMIQSGRLPADVLVCREGMEEWMPADDLGLIQGSRPINQPVEPPSQTEAPNKLAYALGASLVMILAISFGYSAILARNHEKQVGELTGQMDNLKQAHHSSSNKSTQATAELDKLKEEIVQLRNDEAAANKKLADLNTSNNDLISKNKKLFVELGDVTNQLAQITKVGNDSDERVKRADQRAAKAEQNAKAIQAQLNETSKKSQSQAAELQRQINQKDEQRKKQLEALQHEKDVLAADLKFTQTNLTAATKLILDLKKELGDSPVRIGTPKGPKPPVKIKFFAEVGSTDAKFNFAVINKGSGDGVKVGDTFRIESKESGETICHLKITRVQPMVAVGSPGTLNVNRLNPGDLVYRE
tara:strand:+ start:411 stop:1553 length:1143 start_codon:yes stop_codon:yes gene_type:complete